MSREKILRRLERLERSPANREPLVILLAPTTGPNHYWECGAYVCQHTGWRVDREPGEAMPDFVERAELEAQAHAEASRSMLILLHPDSIEEARG